VSRGRIRVVTAAPSPSPSPHAATTAITSATTVPPSGAVRTAKCTVQPTGIPVPDVGGSGRGVLRDVRNRFLRSTVTVERVRANVGRRNHDDDDDDSPTVGHQRRDRFTRRKQTATATTATIATTTSTRGRRTTTQSGHFGTETVGQHGEPGRRIRGRRARHVEHRHGSLSTSLVKAATDLTDACTITNEAIV